MAIFEKEIFWENDSWNTLCLLTKKANTIRIYHLEIMKEKKSIKFNGVMKIAALLKSAPKKKIQTSENYQH